MILVIEGEDDFLMEVAARTFASTNLGDALFEHRWGSLDAFFSYSSLDESTSTHIIWNSESVIACPGNSTVIFVATESKTVNGSEKADKRIFVAKPRVSLDKNEVIQWIIKEGQKRNNDLSKVAGSLFVNVGNRLRKLMSEIEKISDIAGKNETVTPETLKSILCFSAELTPKNIIDSIQEGRTNAALGYYDRLQEHADETGWIIAFLHRYVIQMYRVQIAKESKKSEKEIAGLLEVTDFVYTRFIEPHSGLWTKTSLRDSILCLARLDICNKQGTADVTVELQSEIIRLAEEARNVINAKANNVRGV